MTWDGIGGACWLRLPLPFRKDRRRDLQVLLREAWERDGSPPRPHLLRSLEFHVRRLLEAGTAPTGPGSPIGTGSESSPSRGADLAESCPSSPLTVVWALTDPDLPPAGHNPRPRPGPVLPCLGIPAEPHLAWLRHQRGPSWIPQLQNGRSGLQSRDFLDCSFSLGHTQPPVSKCQQLAPTWNLSASPGISSPWTMAAASWGSPRSPTCHLPFPSGTGPRPSEKHCNPATLPRA